ncbi:hypothetical protein V22_15080 [Calycomorphotria hydatis]|uniref:Uncharacterized protein n=1 Tax=Calycomorphotria hydatis TaxID=2528027 RepID=A0A517T7C6_9PLAN|nr:hypothetical protein V22_15080 [Calycomorphotria hydatis]
MAIITLNDGQILNRVFIKGDTVYWIQNVNFCL